MASAFQTVIGRIVDSRERRLHADDGISDFDRMMKFFLAIAAFPFGLSSDWNGFGGRNFIERFYWSKVELFFSFSHKRTVYTMPNFQVHFLLVEKEAGVFRIPNTLDIKLNSTE